MPVSEPNPVTVTVREIMEHYADECCDQYGWGRKSPAWYDLANLNREVHPEFILKQAKLMYPKAAVIDIQD